MQPGTKYILKWRHDALALSLIALLTAILIYSFKQAREAQAEILSPLPAAIEYVTVEPIRTDPVNPSPAEVAQIIIDEFKDLGPTATAQALNIAYCESRWQADGYNDGNTNGSNDAGVFQINSIHNQPDSLRYNARLNIQWAKHKFIKDGGWAAWSCARYL